MSHVGLVFRHLLYPRVVASIRRDFPLFHIVVWMLLGQLLGEFAIGLGLAAFVLGGVAFVGGAYGVLRSRLALAFLCVGFISASCFVQPLLSNSMVRSAQVKVLSDPRYRKAGMLSALLSVESDLGLKRGTQESELVGKRFQCRAINLPWRNSSAMGKGDRLVVKAEFVPLKLSPNPFSYESYLRRRRISGFCKILYSSRIIDGADAIQTLREYVIAGIRVVFGERAGISLLLAMVIGVPDQLTWQTDQLLRVLGLSHVVVISGMHVGVVFGMLTLLCRLPLQLIGGAWRTKTLIAQTAGLFGAGCYVMLSGASQSGVRALIALLLLVMSTLLERKGALLNQIFGVMLVIMTIWPGIFFEPGMQFTFAALVGFILGRPTRRNASSLYSVAMMSYGATLTTGIVSLFWFDYFAFHGLIMNFFVSPLIILLGCKGGIFAIVAYLVRVDSHGFIIRFLADCLELIVHFLQWYCSLGIVNQSTGSITGKFCMLGLLLVLCGRLWVRRCRHYLMDRGLFDPLLTK